MKTKKGLQKRVPKQRRDMLPKVYGNCLSGHHGNCYAVNCVCHCHAEKEL